MRSETMIHNIKKVTAQFESINSENTILRVRAYDTNGDDFMLTLFLHGAPESFTVRTLEDVIRKGDSQ